MIPRVAASEKGRAQTEFLVVVSDFGKSGSGLKADLDANKKVNIEDLLILLGKYGATC